MIWHAMTYFDFRVYTWQFLINFDFGLSMKVRILYDNALTLKFHKITWLFRTFTWLKIFIMKIFWLQSHFIWLFLTIISFYDLIWLWNPIYFSKLKIYDYFWLDLTNSDYLWLLKRKFLTREHSLARVTLWILGGGRVRIMTCPPDTTAPTCPTHENCRKFTKIY